MASDAARVSSGVIWGVFEGGVVGRGKVPLRLSKFIHFQTRELSPTISNIHQLLPTTNRNTKWRLLMPAPITKALLVCSLIALQLSAGSH